MKRLTLDLTVNGRHLLLNVHPRINGNIEPVIEILGSSIHRDNILVDITSFRCQGGFFEFKSRNGLLGHHTVLDTLARQQGVVILRPGEAITFSLDGQYVHFFNQPTEEGKAFMEFIVSEERLRSHLDRRLADLRNGIPTAPRKKAGTGQSKAAPVESN